MFSCKQFANFQAQERKNYVNENSIFVGNFFELIRNYLLNWKSFIFDAN